MDQQSTFIVPQLPDQPRLAELGAHQTLRLQAQADHRFFFRPEAEEEEASAAETLQEQGDRVEVSEILRLEPRLVAPTEALLCETEATDCPECWPGPVVVAGLVTRPESEETEGTVAFSVQQVAVAGLAGTAAETAASEEMVT